MLSIEHCRRILGLGCRLSDDDLERLREQLYALADVVTAVFAEQRTRGRDLAPAGRGTADLLPIRKTRNMEGSEPINNTHAGDRADRVE
jgi:hypothetical protein